MSHVALRGWGAPVPSTPGKALPPATQHGQLVWKPQPVILDEDEFCFSKRGRRRGARTFHVLGSYGYTVQGRRYVASVEAVP